MQDELKVDMDWRPPKSWLDDYLFFADAFLSDRGIHVETFKIEKSEHGWHIRLPLMKPINDDSALYYQFLLGDDRVRCKLNYGRWKAGIEDWNKLWKCKVGR